MIGAIIGDIVGSIYEFDNHKSKTFPLFSKGSTFTDDTVMTIAVADFMLDTAGNPSQARLISYLHKWYKLYPNLSYGAGFSAWVKKFENDYYPSWQFNASFGNGAAMRISPIGDAIRGLPDCMRNTKFVTEVSHNHPEGIRGAQAIAGLIVLARTEKDRKKLRQYIETEFEYDISMTVAELKKTYQYNETCQGTVPEAIVCFLESKNFEDAIRNAISIGGDSDTLAAITGSIAEAYYGDIPLKILKEAMAKLPDEIQFVVHEFYDEYYINLSKITKKLRKLK